MFRCEYGIRFAATIVTASKMNSTIVNHLSNEYLLVFEERLRKLVMDSTTTTKLVGQMLHYHMGWDDGIKSDVVLGKRIRPLLTLLCTDAAGGYWRNAVTIAAAVELIHNFSLIHDDIQDGDLERRHKPTVWVNWGKPKALQAGNVMRVLADMTPKDYLSVEENFERVSRLSLIHI